LQHRARPVHTDRPFPTPPFGTSRAMAGSRLWWPMSFVAVAAAGRLHPDIGDGMPHIIAPDLEVSIPQIIVPDDFPGDYPDLATVRLLNDAIAPFSVDLPGEWSSMVGSDELFSFQEEPMTSHLIFARTTIHGRVLQRWRLMRLTVDPHDLVGNDTQACYVSELMESHEDELPEFSLAGNVWCRYAADLLPKFPECMDFGPPALPIRSMCKEFASEYYDDYDDESAAWEDRVIDGDGEDANGQEDMDGETDGFVAGGLAVGQWPR